jgi:hypothetical protein
MISTTAKVPLTDPQRKALDAGLRAMGVDAEVLVTDQFAEEVLSRTLSETYTTDRGVGEVAARTIADRIIINAPVALARLDLSGIERLTAHEAGHVILNSRGETFQVGLEVSGSEWEWNLVSMAGVCLEEARIERALMKFGYPAGDPVTHEHLADQLFEINAACYETVAAPQSESLEWMIAHAMTALTRFSTFLAYVAAASAEDNFRLNLPRLGPHSQANWSEYGAPTWEQRMSLYGSVPPCDEPIATRDLQAAILEGANIQAQTLRDMGFEFRDGPPSIGGYGFYNIASPELWTARGRRCLEEASEEDPNEMLLP